MKNMSQLIPKSNIHETKKSIVPLLFWFNIIIFIVGFFFFRKSIFNAAMIANILFLGTYMVITKWGFMFDGLATMNKVTKSLNDLAKVN